MGITPRIDGVRAAVWTVRSLRATRRQLSTLSLNQIRVPPPPDLATDALPTVRRTLRRWPSTCLEQAFVLQRWLGARGDDRDVVIGVTAPGEAFGAHAWVDGEVDDYHQAVHELTRVTSRT